MTAAIIAKTAGDGTDPRKPTVPEIGASAVTALTGTELIMLTKLLGNGSRDPGEYFASAQQLADLAAGGFPLPTSDPSVVDSYFNANGFVRISGAPVTASASLVKGSAISLTTATAADVVTLALTKGNWLISGVLCITGASSTTLTRAAAGISTTTNTMPTAPGSFANVYMAGATMTTIGEDLSVAGMLVMATVASTATYRLIALATFGVSTLSAFGEIVAIPVG